MSDLDDCSLFEETGEEKSFTMMLEALAVADPDIDDNSCFSFGLLDLDGVETLVSFLQLQFVKILPVKNLIVKTCKIKKFMIIRCKVLFTLITFELNFR